MYLGTTEACHLNTYEVETGLNEVEHYVYGKRNDNSINLSTN